MIIEIKLMNSFKNAFYKKVKYIYFAALDPGLKSLGQNPALSVIVPLVQEAIS